MSIHATADVSPLATIGARTRVWHQAQVREGARIGVDCIVGKGAYIGADVVVGDRCKIQNAAMLYEGLTLADGVFVGPGVIFTNDRHPRAITPDGALKGADDWKLSPTTVDEGASLGAAAVVVAGVRIGRFALVGAGAVVTRDVPAFGVVVGVPARLIGFACACGATLHGESCAACGRGYVVTGAGDAARCAPR